MSTNFFSVLYWSQKTQKLWKTQNNKINRYLLRNDTNFSAKWISNLSELFLAILAWTGFFTCMNSLISCTCYTTKLLVIPHFSWVYLAWKFFLYLVNLHVKIERMEALTGEHLNQCLFFGWFLSWNFLTLMNGSIVIFQWFGM